MKFGVCIPSHRNIMPIAAVMDQPKRAEDLGFDSIWVNDHVVVTPHDIDVRGFSACYYEPFMVLANAAARTSRVRLGSTIVQVPLRHAVLQAKLLSTLDALSAGRVIYGIGVGTIESEFNALGVPYRERGAITDEAMEAMRVLWTEEDPKFEGKYYSFSGIKFEPKPVQQPHIPIWVGGTSKAAYRRTGQYGDAWHPNATTLDELTTGIAAVREQWQKHRRQGQPQFTQRLGVRFYPEAREGRRILGRGTVGQVIENLQSSQELGIDYVVVDFALTASTPVEQWNHDLEMFVRDVMPKFA